MFDLAPVDELVDALAAADIRAATDPADLNPPCVWVQVTDLNVDTLGTFKASLRLVLLVPDANSRRAMAQLLALAALVGTVLPVRKATPRTQLMPDGTRLPALAVPWSVRGNLTN